jgi:hypothetical protein
MMNCPDISTWQEWLEGSWGNAEEQLLNEHLKVCPACRAIVNQCKIIDWNLYHLNVPAPDAAELEHVRHQATEQIQAQLPPRTSSLGLGDLYNVSLGNLKYATYYTSFLPIPRWLPRRTNQHTSKKPEISRLVRKGLGK